LMTRGSWMGWSVRPPYFGAGGSPPCRAATNSASRCVSDRSRDGSCACVRESGAIALKIAHPAHAEAAHFCGRRERLHGPRQWVGRPPRPDGGDCGDGAGARVCRARCVSCGGRGVSHDHVRGDRAPHQVVEALAGFEHKYAYSIVGHSGSGDSIMFVDWNKPPRSDEERLALAQAMYSHSRGCVSGDNTVSAAKKAVTAVTSEEGDDYFVFLLSDANLVRACGLQARLGGFELAAAAAARLHAPPPPPPPQRDACRTDGAFMLRSCVRACAGSIRCLPRTTSCGADARQAG
jgi:hypothetical protein